MEYRSLGNTGLRVSALSLGCAPLGNVYGDLSISDREQIVRMALDTGINFFDTSP